MKIVLFSLASILLIHCITPSSAKIQCHKCKIDEQCEGEGQVSQCAGDGINCYYTMTGDSKKIKGCRADKEASEKPELKGLKDLKVTPTMKWDGCFDITMQKDYKQAYKTCFCTSNECNKNKIIKSDMVTSTGEKGTRKCYTCGKLSEEKKCTEEEIKDKENTLKDCKSGNCFIVDSKRTKNNKESSEIYKGCMEKDSESTYVYGSLKFDDDKKFEGSYYVCNKNECNYDEKSWKESSVAGLTSSFVLIFTGLLSYHMFN